jgi:phosphoglycerol transferase MdoB-like AlkP superfamily enzyme
VGGRALVPPDKFHLPGVILGTDISPQKIGQVASQIDMLPTFLALAGIEGIGP